MIDRLYFSIEQIYNSQTFCFSLVVVKENVCGFMNQENGLTEIVKPNMAQFVKVS